MQVHYAGVLRVTVIRRGSRVGGVHLHDLARTGCLNIKGSRIVCAMSEDHEWKSDTSSLSSTRKISGLILLDKVKSASIGVSQNIKLLLLRLERSQLRWYGNVV